MKKLFTAVVCIGLSGCMASSGSPKALKASTDRVHRICHDAPTRATFDLLSQRMSNCYLRKPIEIPIQAGAVFTSVSTQTRIDAIFQENATSEITVSMQGGLAPRVFGEHVEIRESEKCASLVEVYILNTFWEKRADHVKSWLKGEAVDCRYM